MKKKIIIGIFLLLLLIIVSVFLINKFTLNTTEKELLSVLIDLNYSLRNPKSTDGDTMNYMPTEPITLKQYIHTIYEARKIHTDNGNLTFLFKVGFLKEDNSEYESIIVVSNGGIVGMTIDNNLINSNSSEEESELSSEFADSLQEAFIDSLNEVIKERWEEAIVLEKVNFDKILKKI